MAALVPAQIESLPWEPVGDCMGVYAKELCRLADTAIALIGYAPDARTPGYAHPGVHQHIWVLTGSARVAGRHVGPGSYVHVPPGVPHPIEAMGSDGCELLQLSARTAG